MSTIREYINIQKLINESDSKLLKRMPFFMLSLIKMIKVRIGSPISYQMFNSTKTHFEWAQLVKEQVYILKNKLNEKGLSDYLRI